MQPTPPSLFSDVFAPQLFAPHGMCLMWRPFWMWLFAASDVGITVAYVTISLMTVRWMVYTNGVPYEPRLSLIYLWCAAFIFLCGLTHLYDFLTLWYPIYFTFGWLNLVTALVSLYTAFFVMPRAPGLIHGVAERMRGLEADRARLLQHLADQVVYVDEELRQMQAEVPVIPHAEPPSDLVIAGLVVKLRSALDDIRSLQAIPHDPPIPALSEGGT